MRFSKFYLFAIGATTLTNMSANADLYLNKPILCPSIQETDCSGPCLTGKWNCDVNKGGVTWQTNTCSQPFTSVPKSFKFLAAVISHYNPRPYCQYNAYYTSDKTGLSVNVELFNSHVKKTNCIVNRQKTGFECTIIPSPAPLS